jgi:hypothetical protein
VRAQDLAGQVLFWLTFACFAAPIIAIGPARPRRPGRPRRRDTFEGRPVRRRW